MAANSFTFSFNMIRNTNIKFILLLIVFTIALDFLLGTFLDALYFSEKSRKNDRLIHSVLETDEEVLIFGSSRAIHHYNPAIIEDSLRMSCYNVGSGGQNIYYHLALLESALERYTPKVAFLELMFIDFEETSAAHKTEKLGVFLPFVNRSVAAKKAVLLRGESEKLKLLTSTYPFNSIFYRLYRNTFWPLHVDVKGFIPIQRMWNKRLANKDVETAKTDINKLKALYRFVEICLKNKIELYIFISPHFANFNGLSKYSQISENLKKLYDIEVISFESDSIFLHNPQYFADPFHLNENGADAFTKLISGIIKK